MINENHTSHRNNESMKAIRGMCDLYSPFFSVIRLPEHDSVAMSIIFQRCDVILRLVSDGDAGNRHRARKLPR